ncbi:MAG: hypothetical protein ACRDSR_14050 [Pseudonocardiaceae bacterium]
MAVARFQVMPAARYVHLSASSGPDPNGGVAARLATGFAWRFMAANNRSLARSTRIAPDVESCLETIRILQKRLPDAVGETSRNGNGQWVWRVRVAGEVVATATRTYQRHVRARLTCDSFLELVAEVAPSAPVQVIYR